MAVVIDALSWHRFQVPLKDGWIRWNSPAFLRAPDEWDRFLLAQRQRYPDLETELAPLISSIRLWVLRLTDDYDYVLEYDALPAANPQPPDPADER